MIAPLYQLSRDLREGRLSAISLAEHCIERLDARESLQAYRVQTPELCRQAARAADACLAFGADPGVLSGLPISVKDLYGITGLETYAGSPRAVPGRWSEEGPLIKNLRNQLGAFIGKTHTVEFAFGGLGINSHWGTPVNPWDAENHRVPGGSSCGAGVSLIQGSALLALGTDTAGSVRIPASMTGTAGLKTSAGRWSLEGIFPLSRTLDTAGILARSVEDIAFAFAAMDPWIEQSPWSFVDGLRDRSTPPVFGVGEPAIWQDAQDDIANAATKTLNRLDAHGARCLDIPLPEAGEAQNLLRQGNVVSAELSEFLQSEMPDWLDTLDPLVGSRIRDGGSISASDWLARKRTLERISASASTRFEQCDVIACPTVPITPPKLADVSEIEAYRTANMASLHHTCIANSLSLCAISLPIALDQSNMPVGLQLVAPHGEEENLLSVALWIEDRIGKPEELLGQAPGA